MIIYSITIKIDVAYHNQWLNWMKEVHIPDVLATGKFVDYNFYKILAENETDGFTYNVQYMANSMSDYFDYQKEYAPKLQSEHLNLFKDKFVAIRTLLKDVK